MTMRGAVWHKGHSIGWTWAGEFATASRAAKRRILARLRRMSDSFNPLVQGVWSGLNDRAECRYDARRAGMDVRNIRTDRLAAAVERLS
jgi:hypothetical protein